jgi:hypothetical protein
VIVTIYAPWFGGQAHDVSKATQALPSMPRFSMKATTSARPSRFSGWS